MITSICIDRDVPMKTRDGITLSADVYRPDDGRRYPAILSWTPYNKVWSGNKDFLTPMDRDVPMKNRDDITLRADVHRPDDGKKLPGHPELDALQRSVVR